MNIFTGEWAQAVCLSVTFVTSIVYIARKCGPWLGIALLAGVIAYLLRSYEAHPLFTGIAALLFGAAIVVWVSDRLREAVHR